MRWVFAIFVFWRSLANCDQAWIFEVVGSKRPQGNESRFLAAVCRRELRANVVPSTCFSILPRNHRGAKNRIIERLESACERAQGLSPKLELSHLGPKCRERVKKLKMIAKYRREGGTSWPRN